MRILFLSPSYPPGSDPGANRAAIFASFLAERGHRVHVLAPRGSKTDPGSNIILHEEPVVSGQGVVSGGAKRARLGRVPNLMSVRDPSSAWCKAAFNEAVRIATEHDIDVIVTSSNPVSASLLGLRVQKRTNKAWVTEFRDPWTQSPFGQWETKLHYRRSRYLNGQVAKFAHRVLMNTEAARAQLLEREPSLDAAKFGVLPNGWTSSSVARVVENQSERLEVTTPLILRHVGKMHGLGETRWSPGLKVRLWRFLNTAGQYRLCDFDGLARSPHYVEKAFAELDRRGFDVRSSFRFEQIGQVPGDTRLWVETAEFGGLFGFTDRVTRAEALELQQTGDIQVVMQLRPQDGSECPCVASKIYDLLRIERPILALVPEGEMRDLLVAAGCEFIAEPDEPASIADALERVIERVSSQASLRRKFDLPASREWQVICSELEEILFDAARNSASA